MDFRLILCLGMRVAWNRTSWTLEREDTGDFFFCPVPPHVLVDFVVLPPGHGRSVTDF